MRIIKFRGQRKDTKEWVYGNLMSSSYLPENVLESYIITCFAGGNEGEIVERFKVIPETVGQFTSLKDKNGKEIYEGDILKWICVGEEGGNTEDIGKLRNMGNSQVIFKDGKFISHITIPVGHFDREEIEVIGNVYENQDMIK